MTGSQCIQSPWRVLVSSVSLVQLITTAVVVHHHVIQEEIAFHRSSGILNKARHRIQSFPTSVDSPSN